MELSVRISTGPASTIVAEARSVDAVPANAVSYSRVEVTPRGASPGDQASAVRSALARAVAELPEPVQGAVAEVVLDLGGGETQVFAELGLTELAGTALISEELQARTGVAMATPIRVERSATPAPESG